MSCASQEAAQELLVYLGAWALLLTALFTGFRWCPCKKKDKDSEG